MASEKFCPHRANGLSLSLPESLTFVPGHHSRRRRRRRCRRRRRPRRRRSRRHCLLRRVVLHFYRRLFSLKIHRANIQLHSPKQAPRDIFLAAPTNLFPLLSVLPFVSTYVLFCAWYLDLFVPTLGRVEKKQAVGPGGPQRPTFLGQALLFSFRKNNAPN